MTIVQPPYDAQFFAALSGEVARSAAACVPLIIEALAPRSVIDVGCGQGDWLAAFRRCGVEDIVGVDGDYLDRAGLRIPASAFLARNLARPLAVERRFDLALSLEVAEHLPASSASGFVVGLTRLAPAVVFSAAVPGQGGVAHVNEQWPWYWKERFAEYGFVQLDPFRKLIWGNPDVAVYYKQNLFLYVDPAVHQGLVDRVGVPGRLQELTLVRTTILQDMTSSHWALRLLSRVWGRVRRRFIPGPKASQSEGRDNGRAPGLEVRAR